jgi:tagatose-6-phosphate ketose/aldose isomerase
MLNLPMLEKEKLGLVHTPREINQQPETWLETFQILKKVQCELRTFLGNCGLTQGGSDRLVVTLIGAGTSDYIGRAIIGLLKKEWRCHVQTIPSTDVMTEMDELVNSAPDGSRHLWISFSRSGDSFEGVKVIQSALEKYPDINHLIITCNANGQMANELSAGQPTVFCIALNDKVNDRGLAMTSSFTNMVIAGQCLAHIWDLDTYQPTLELLVASAARILPKTAALAGNVAEKNYSRICFLGTGPLKAVGDESALKVMELTAGYFSVMSESFLGLRHGPLSWLNRDSLVVGFLSNNTEKLRVELGLLEELNKKAITGNILAVVPQENLTASDFTDYELILGLPKSLDDKYRPPIDVLFAQCLGLFASLHHGLKPDTPSADGKIQRVVSKITFA